MADGRYDAVLHHWCVVGYRTPSDEVQVIVGMVTEDRKQRFADGRWMMTSILLSPTRDAKEGAVVRTLNSRYLLGERLKAPTGAPGTGR